VLALQKQVARAIAEQINVTVTPQEAARLSTAPTVNPAAYDAWAKGWYQFTRLTHESLHKCLEYAGAALAIDASYAAAYALTASCSTTLPNLAGVAPHDAHPQAEAAARQALRLDEGRADAHFALGWTLASYNWNWAGAERAFRRGLELDPSSSFGHARFGWVLSWLGRHDEALTELERAAQLNPTGLYEIQALAAVHYTARKYQDAVITARRGTEIEPAFAFAQTRLGMAYAELGRYEEAVVALETAVKLTGDLHNKGGLARAYALAGRPRDARRTLDELLNLNQRRYVGPLEIAMSHLALGEKDEAIRWLEEGYRVRDGNMILLKVWPPWDSLRGDPRFQDLLRRMNFP
jgi:serine/threonine-protein kinase